MKQICEKILDVVIPLCTSVFGGYALFFVLNETPLERNMGAVQKILYVHVGSALSTYLALAVMSVAAVCFFTFRDAVWIQTLRAASQVAFTFASIVLLTGMIWGYSSWGTWWRWEPRLVSVLILWVFLLAIRYMARQKFHTEQEEGVVLGVMGILSAVQVPIVMFSIKLLDRTEQLHPEVVAQQGLTVDEYKIALILANISLMLLCIWMVRVRFLAEHVSARVRIAERRVIMKADK